nr:LacI family DNA-binding transcriptional regulator [Curvibacter sp. CHRR-16]
MGYVANLSAQKLSSGRSHVIGLLTANLSSSTLGGLASEIVKTAASHQYEVVIYPVMDQTVRPHQTVMHLMQQFTDGIIALWPHDHDFLDQLKSTQHPVVTIDSRSDNNPFITIEADSYGGGRMVMEHLAKLGHYRVAFVTGKEGLSSARERKRAYQDATLLHKLDTDPELILQGDFSFESGQVAANQVLAMDNRPTAVFASNDKSAMGLIYGLQQGGLRIPQDISVVGFDDMPGSAHIYPGLTTVSQPLADMGRAAVNSLLAHMAGLESPTKSITLPVQLAQRNSTAAPAAPSTSIPWR